MTLFLYNLIIWLLIPFALLRLLYRSLIQPEYLNYWQERLGVYSSSEVDAHVTQTLWVHCVSLGETNATMPLIKMIIKEHPGINILLSHGTLTGRNAFISNSKKIKRCYLPFDSKGLVIKFLDHYQPTIGIILETEIWPNLIHQCHINKIPLFLVNARLSEKSLMRYLPYKNFISKSINKINHIYVQSENDKKNFNKLTNQPISIMGNLKFDARPPENIIYKIKKLKSQLRIDKKFVIVVSSSRDGEEDIVLNFFKRINLKNIVIIIVPRHPERFNEVSRLFESYRLPYIRKSNLKKLTSPPQYILGDTMGELYEYYGLANLVIMGGSIKNTGSQNIIEPMLLNRPIAVGPSIFNFKNIIEVSQKKDLVFRFSEIDELEGIILRLIKDKELENKIKKKTNIFIKENSGASKKILKLINQYF
ncbi:MAG: 3-deoxy-D-manno-octulosonic acid transferase [Methylophilaceae bacterium]|jgi:3-deoxy-D-manno-octulosonic-acid transferase|nr:3-deoxy-D-manno-octulosonic acid transferase [Methylophilaceae bacterium]